MTVLSAPEAGRGHHGHYGALSSVTTTTGLSADPELDSKLSEYIAHHRTRSLSSPSTESHSPTSRGSTFDPETTNGTSTSQVAIGIPTPGPRGNSTTTVEGGVVVVATSKGYEILYQYDCTASMIVICLTGLILC